MDDTPVLPPPLPVVRVLVTFDVSLRCGPKTNEAASAETDVVRHEW